MRIIKAPVAQDSLKIILDFLPRTGIALQDLLERAGVKEQDLEPVGGVVEWDTFIRLLRALLTHEKSNTDAKAFGIDSIVKGGALTVFVKAVKNFMTPASLYEFVAKVSGKYLFPCLKISIERPNEDLQIMVIEGPAQAEEVGEIYFEMLKWHYSAVTYVCGMGWADVDLEIEGRRATYTIQLPLPGTLLFRLKRSFQWLFSYKSALDFMTKQQRTLDARQDQVQALEQERSILLDSLPLGVLVFQKGRPEFLNQTARKMLAVEDAYTDGLLMDAFRPVLEKEFSDGMLVQLEREKGNARQFLIHHRTRMPFQGKMSDVITVSENVSQNESEHVKEYRKRLEETSKLAEMGMMTGLNQIAGGFAHEINNPLMILTGSLDRLERAEQGQDGVQPEFLKKTTQTMRKSAHRIASLVDTILCYTDFGRQSRATGTFSTPENLMEQVSALFAARSRDEGVAFSTHAPTSEHGKSLSGLGDQLAQILLPLIQNAMDAVHEHPKKKVELFSNWSDGSLVIEVRDSGPGISTEHREKIFFPFFSTRTQGQHTGLGLNTALGIARQIRADLTFETSESGTTFRLVVPREQFESDSKQATRVAV